LAHPDAEYLIDRVQQVYVVRYGGRDDDPLDPADFLAPNGGFYVAYLDGRPSACGAWRRSTHPALGSAHTAEVKRMYVVEEAQRHGIARRVLAHLEAEVARAGIAVITLETGPRQPEALALYRQAGYVPIARFGHYAAHASAHFLGKRLAGE
jgi:ribosomal protein S18 acetylase RimI-like enzyme